MTGSMLCRVAALLLLCGAAASCAETDTAAGDECCAEGAQTPGTVASPLPSGSSVPEEPESFSFAVIGDFGTGGADQHDVARRMCSWREKHGFDLVFTTGDNVYPDGHPDRFEDAFYEPYECLTDDGVAFHAVLGNHDAQTDNGRPEIEDPAFGMAKRNYVVRTGGVRFVMIDSNSVNMDFLRRATRARSGDDWTVVAMHHPVYSPGTGHGSEPGFRPKLPRLFRKRGVDLVLQGHDHVYAVTKPLKGIRYVVTGGGGAGLYGCTDQPFSAKCEARHHFLYVTATADELVVRAVPAEGKPFHTFRTPGI